MFSVSPAELVTIGVVALLVFGPKRLPEIARKMGRIARDLREAAHDLKSGIEEEYREVIEPLDQAGREMREALGDLKPDRRPPSEPAGETRPDPPAANERNEE